MASLASKASLYACSTAIGIFAQLIMIPILLNALSIESYGEVGLYLGLTAIFTAILPVSSENAIARSVFEEDQNLNQQVFETGNTIVVVTFFLILMITWFLRYWLTEALSNVVLLAAFSSVLQVVLNFILVQLQMREEVIKYFLISVCHATFTVALTIYWLPTLDVFARYFAPIVSSFVVLILYCAITECRYVYFKLGVAGWDYVRRVGIPLAPHSLVGVSANYLDRFVLKFLGYDVLLGFYTLSSQLVNAVQAALSAVNNAYTPWIFAKIRENRAPQLRSTILILFSLCAGLILFLSWLVPLVPPNKYSVVLNSLFLVPFYIFFEGSYYLVAPILYFNKLGTKISTISLITAAVRVGLLFIYLYNYEPSLEGVLVTLVVASSVKAMITIWAARLQNDT